MQCEKLSFSPSAYSESSTSILQVVFFTFRRFVSMFTCIEFLWFLSFFVALPQFQDKNIKDNTDMESKINQENNRKLSLVTK